MVLRRSSHSDLVVWVYCPKRRHDALARSPWQSHLASELLYVHMCCMENGAEAWHRQARHGTGQAHNQPNNNSSNNSSNNSTHAALAATAQQRSDSLSQHSVTKHDFLTDLSSTHMYNQTLPNTAHLCWPSDHASTPQPANTTTVTSIYVRNCVYV